MMSSATEVGGIALRPGDPSLSKGGLPTDKGWRKGSRTDSRLLAQVAHKTGATQVDAGRSRGGGGAAVHTRAGGKCAFGPFSMQAKKAMSG